MQGKMLWFNEQKEHGFILTDEGERLYVHRDGFLPGQPPVVVTHPPRLAARPHLAGRAQRPPSFDTCEPNLTGLDRSPVGCRHIIRRFTGLRLAAHNTVGTRWR